MPLINFVLNRIQYDATTFQQCKLICKLIIKTYFFCFHVNDDQFNEKTCPSNYPFRSRRFGQENIDFTPTTHPFLQSNKRKKTKNEKGRRKILD